MPSSWSGHPFLIAMNWAGRVRSYSQKLSSYVGWELSRQQLVKSSPGRQPWTCKLSITVLRQSFVTQWHYYFIGCVMRKCQVPPGMTLARLSWHSEEPTRGVWNSLLSTARGTLLQHCGGAHGQSFTCTCQGPGLGSCCCEHTTVPGYTWLARDCPMNQGFWTTTFHVSNAQR
jgi:hypothetical protein